MINDILAILWKEWKELFQQRGMRGAVFNWVVMVALLGVFMPLQFGRDWVDRPLVMLLWSWLPILAAIGVVADSFAGERERHTLETLLASRLSDRAILFGKIITVVAFGWSIEIAGTLLALVTVNIAHGNGELLLYPWGLYAAVLGLSLAAILLVASLGALVSLRSATVRSAYQKMSIAFIALAILPSLIIPNLPAGIQSGLSNLVAVRPDASLFLILTAILIGLDAILIGITLNTFQRARLILD